jgi:hypothetical protein
MATLQRVKRSRFPLDDYPFRYRPNKYRNKRQSRVGPLFRSGKSHAISPTVKLSTDTKETAIPGAAEQSTNPKEAAASGAAKQPTNSK